jgi:hypothetical protein
MAKRWVISRDAEIGGHPVDYFVGCYDKKEDALENAARYSLNHNCIHVTVFEAIETVKASIPSIVVDIPAVTEAVQP